MIGYKVRLFSSHRKDKNIEAEGEYFYYRYFICSRSLIEIANYQLQLFITLSCSTQGFFYLRSARRNMNERFQRHCSIVILNS